MTGWEVAVGIRADLGEGPVWDSTAGCLWFVDIHGRSVHRLDASAGTVARHDVARQIGAAIPRTDGGLVLALDNGIHLYTWGESTTELVIPVGDGDPAIRMNDAKCDPRGRLWAGTMATDFRPGVSTLFRFGRRGAFAAVRGCALANGLGWSPDGTRMYFVDSRRRIVEAFDYDVETGEISGRRTWLTVPEADGWADGLTVDAEGGVWVAMYLNGAVHRYDPDGALSEVIRLPTRKVTSVCFGGTGLADLYVTSASSGLSARELEAEPQAGFVFVVPGAGAGQPTVRFDPATIRPPGH